MVKSIRILVALTALATILMSCGLGSTAHSTLPTPETPLVSTEGQIAFTRARSLTEANIFIMNADGSQQTALTNAPGLNAFPSWSPDGTRIAFVSNRDGNWEIYVMNADGSKQTRLTTTPTDDAAPVWAPDSKQLAYTSDWNGRATIYLMNSDGSNQRLLVAGNWATWSPDGTQLIFTSYGTSEQLAIINVDGTNRRLLSPKAGDYEASWSPDGQQIAFVSNRDGNEEIYRMEVDGSNITRLTNLPGNDHWPPAWSPDGTRIAFTADGTRNNSEIYVMNADGSGLTNLSQHAESDAFPTWKP